MELRVAGAGLDPSTAGSRPVGQSKRVLRSNAEYRPPQASAWSFDVAIAHHGDRVASRDNRLILPAYTLIDLGARYRMKIGRASATLRLQLANLTDELFLPAPCSRETASASWTSGATPLCCSSIGEEPGVLGVATDDEFRTALARRPAHRMTGEPPSRIC